MFPLRWVRVENFRSVRELDLPLDPRVTVVFGPNGKTTLFDALCIGVGAIGARMPRTCGRDFRRSDFRSAHGETSPFTSIAVRASNGVAWQVSQKRDRTVSVPKDYLGRRALHAWLDPRITAIQQDFGNRSVLLPVVAAYGTECALDFPSRLPDDSFPRLAGLEFSLKSPSRFEGVVDWFLLQEDEERRARIDRRDWAYRLPELEWFRRALSVAIRACSNPRTVTAPHRLLLDVVGDDGAVVTCDIRELSDGHLAHFLLVADLARRCVQLNPSDDLDSLQHGTRSAGVVVIDEVELHAPGPSQATVLPLLLAAFPNLQFVVTTASAEVVASVGPHPVLAIENAGGEIRIGPRPLAPTRSPRTATFAAAP